MIIVILILVKSTLSYNSSQQGLKAVFDEAIRSVLSPPSLGKSKKASGKDNRGCTLF
jgi:hypothetical protein